MRRAGLPRSEGLAKSANLARLTPEGVDPSKFPARSQQDPAALFARNTSREMVLHVPTFSPKQSDITRTWYEIDATDLTLGRLATEVALRLKGKHKPIYSPHVDTGDHIVIVNASKVYLEPGKAARTFFYTHSGYPGGLHQKSMTDRLATKPEEVIRQAVRGMLPKNSLGRQQLTKLKVYQGALHPHEAQKPVKLELPQARRKTPA